MSHDFEAFLKEREAAANAYVNGDAKPLGALSTTTDPATFYSPQGDVVQGAPTVTARYDKDVSSFRKPGETHFEVLQSGSEGALAFWTGYQHAEVHLGDKPDPIPMKLRVTEVFRFEAGSWRLVHRHADAPNKPEP